MTDKTHRSAVTGDYSNLRALAEACPPEDDVNSEWYSEDRLTLAIVERDRPFVAACSPAVVLGMLDDLDRLRDVNHVQKIAIDGYREAERMRPEPIVRTVGDLTARHIGKRVRVGGGRALRLDGLDNRRRDVKLDIADGQRSGRLVCERDTPCEVLP